MGRNRINDFEPKRIGERTLLWLHLMKTPVKQNPQRVKAGENTSEQRIRNDDGSVRRGRQDFGVREAALSGKKRADRKTADSECDSEPGGESRPVLS